MKCPSCGFSESRVVDSRPSEDGAAIRRRRECLQCSRRFTTYERMGDNPLIVIKSDGSSQAYNREKLFRSLLVACAKRSIAADQLEALIDNIESDLRMNQKTEIRSSELGDLVLVYLKKLDDVAYVRFASVYKDFKNIDEFMRALESINE